MEKVEKFKEYMEGRYPRTVDGEDNMLSIASIHREIDRFIKYYPDLNELLVNPNQVKLFEDDRVETKYRDYHGRVICIGDDILIEFCRGGSWEKFVDVKASHISDDGDLVCVDVVGTAFLLSGFLGVDYHRVISRYPSNDNLVTAGDPTTYRDDRGNLIKYGHNVKVYRQFPFSGREPYVTGIVGYDDRLGVIIVDDMRTKHVLQYLVASDDYRVEIDGGVIEEVPQTFGDTQGENWLTSGAINWGASFEGMSKILSKYLVIESDPDYGIRVSPADDYDVACSKAYESDWENVGVFDTNGTEYDWEDNLEVVV